MVMQSTDSLAAASWGNALLEFSNVCQRTSRPCTWDDNFEPRVLEVVKRNQRDMKDMKVVKNQPPTANARISPTSGFPFYLFCPRKVVTTPLSHQQPASEKQTSDDVLREEALSWSPTAPRYPYAPLRREDFTNHDHADMSVVRSIAKNFLSDNGTRRMLEISMPHWRLGKSILECDP
ncbi:hypothetical protein CC86DRAFT_138953 [Ophiobolus disseminans]|uniref:Uncharacterized protein n=1 Tax=Ophiobolus disseminans TaxID=1469910 RepID=A0A6A7ADX2_9PLEO|nr:hypothetical protein CC86DRAFT_138953 [Ophiobolus disseminans]